MSFIDSILGRGNTDPAPQPSQVAQPTQVKEDPKPINPLDAYSKMFDTPATSDGPPIFAIDDNVLNDVSSKLNFINGVDPNLMQKAQNGDAGAMIELMQDISRRAYSAALKHTTALTDTHLNRRGDYEKTALSKNVKNSLTQEALSSVPNSDHPVVKSELQRIAKSIAAQNPDAPAAEIAKQAREYFATVHNAMYPQSQSQSGPKTAGEIDDWESFLSSN